MNLILRGGKVPNFDAEGVNQAGDKRIIGVMIESHLVAGRQEVVNGIAQTYGQSITDACINFDTTATIIDQLATAVRNRRQT